MPRDFFDPTPEQQKVVLIESLDMRRKIYARKAEIPEGLDERCSAAQRRSRMNAQLVRGLNRRCRDLDKRIRSQLARLKFTSIFRHADDDTKQEMIQIMILDIRSPKMAEAKMHAFLANRISK